MKRQRSTAAGEVATTRKKTKRIKKTEVATAAVEEERVDCMAAAQETLELALMYSEEWSCNSLWAVGDEQMSWGTYWFPFWDIEFMGEAYDALYNDVVWDDDIWNLKSIKEIPEPEEMISGS